jgi:glutamate racemase
MATASPIGVFDSGVGGLSILGALRVALPREDFVYLADNAHAPYGEKTAEFVRERSLAVARQLVDQHSIKALVVACNTATAAAIGALRERWPLVPIVGVEPALKPAVALTQTRRIGVMATRGTVDSERFAALRAGLKDEAAFAVQACDGLAEAIEHDDPPQVRALCAQYLRALGTFGHGPGEIDTLVLGCTHYPFAAATLLELLPDDVELVHTGPAVARQCARVLRDHHLARENGPGSLQWISTGASDALQRAVARWLDGAV